MTHLNGINEEDFCKPKIIWKRIGSILRFSYDDKKVFGLDSTCIATGKHISYLCCVLNSDMGHYLLKDSPKTGTGDLLVSVQAMEPILIPFDKNIELQLNAILKIYLDNNTRLIDEKINRIVYSLYRLSADECQYITETITQFQ